MRKTLDTNICSYILRNHPQHILDHFSSIHFEDIWISAIVAAELRYGAAKLGSVRLTAAVESWLSGFEIKAWPVEASAHYARIRNDLQRLGMPIGNMDLLIAAHALAQDSAVITNNVREFLRVPGLAVLDWSAPA